MIPETQMKSARTCIALASARCNASSAPTLKRIRSETNRRNHRDYAVLPFPDDDGLSTRRACAAPKDCRKPGTVHKILRQESRSSYLDGERSLHGGLGSHRDAPTFAPLRRHRTDGRGC